MYVSGGVPFRIIGVKCMVTYYCKSKNNDTWHWCRNCTDWPTSNYDEEVHPGIERPKTGELCSQCEMKEKAGECL